MLAVLYHVLNVFLLSLGLFCILFTAAHLFGWRCFYFKGGRTSIKPYRYTSVQCGIGVCCFEISLSICTIGYLLWM